MQVNYDFLNVYKELEQRLAVKYPKILSTSERISLFKNEYLKNEREKMELDFFRSIRNVLAHEINTSYLTIDDEAIRKLKSYIRLLDKEPYIYEISVKEIIYARSKDLVVEVMKLMIDKGFTHIPLFDNDGKLMGVFSDNTLFSILLNESFQLNKEKTTFNDPVIQKYCRIDSHLNHDFRFVSKYAFVNDVKNLFIDSTNKSKRNKITMIFITENGCANEKIIGLVTPNDLLEIRS